MNNTKKAHSKSEILGDIIHDLQNTYADDSHFPMMVGTKYLEGLRFTIKHLKRVRARYWSDEWKERHGIDFPK
ncbi:MAG: hypothetical protein V3V88_03530 [Dehalococcoidia bacterium]